MAIKLAKVPAKVAPLVVNGDHLVRRLALTEDQYKLVFAALDVQYSKAHAVTQKAYAAWQAAADDETRYEQLLGEMVWHCPPTPSD